MSTTPRAIAINGSPRKQWNTAMLLEKALEGAASAGAETEMIHLYDLDYKGCTSCFSCKKKERYRDGVCAMKDDLSPVLARAVEAGAIFLGSPIYLGDVTGAMRSFYERLVFCNLAYDEQRSYRERGPSVGLIYTMNVPQSVMEELGYPVMFKTQETYLKGLKGRQVEYMAACDTCQFADYAPYHAPRFNAVHKLAMREKQFPLDCGRAFEMGARLMRGAAAR